MLQRSGVLEVFIVVQNNVWPDHGVISFAFHEFVWDSLSLYKYQAIENNKRLL